ncbi:YtxH domain-containing protein [Paenibacillus hexagrammi]|uniref:YtxH domain-containing protein n=1 Tax=Paenibacillus hexagrammi TaxID=2908839 RepID=A0ABY3SF08_9BACL|nr:YtxH domain-containing protein [Paenibacillus sp. YPD9-1]UJF31660.1 YtxH domain-containing protein [Paenibacillus sp. YPD9-1]
MIGAVVGGVLGAATALLFAPKSGRELRSDIAEQAQAVTDKTAQIASSVGKKTQEIAKTVSTQTSGLYDKAKGTAATVVENVRSWKEPKNEVSVEDEIAASEAAEDLVVIGGKH